jgi:predicted transcriptional regulator
MSNKVINVNEEIHYKLKIIATKTRKSLKEILTEAINFIFEKYKEELK